MKIELLSESYLDQTELLEIEYIKQNLQSYYKKDYNDHWVTQFMSNLFFSKKVVQKHENNDKYNELVNVLKRDELIHPTLRDIFYKCKEIIIIIAVKNNKVFGFATFINGKVIDIYAINDDEQVLNQLRNHFNCKIDNK